MNRVQFHVKKGDQIEVVSGNHKGASGKVLAILRKKQQVLVEGVRLIKKHERKSQENPQGLIAQREGPIHISNVRKLPEGALSAKATGKKSKKNAT